MSIESIKYHILNLFSTLGFTSKSVNVDLETLEEFNINGYLAQINIASTNNVIEFSKGDKKYYFRECKKVVSQREFACGLINDFSDMTKLPIARMIKIVSLYKFMNMGTLGDESSALYKYMHDHNIKRLGLEQAGDVDINISKIDLFIHYAWGEILNFKINRNSGSYQLYNYNRARCQYELYKLLGIERLICPIKLIKIKCHDGTWKVGSIMTKAPGISPNDIPDIQIKEMSSDNLVRDLNSLNIMDALCTEGDHRPDNYNLVLDNGKITSICAYDNDSPLSFFLTSGTHRTSMSTGDIVDKGLLRNKKYLDIKFCNKIKKTSSSQIRKYAFPYLSRWQLFFLICRYKKIQDAVKNIKANKQISPEISPNEICLIDNHKSASYFLKLIEWNSINELTKDIFKEQHNLQKLSITI